MTAFTSSIANLAVTLHAVTSTELDTLHDALVALTDPWGSYTPTFSATSFSLGNGSLTGSYMQVGKLVHAHFELVGGSTTNFGSTAWSIALPVAANHGTGGVLGTIVAAVSSGGARLGGWLWQNTGTTCAAVKEDGTRWGASVPLAFVSGSEVRGNLVYEAA